MKLFEVTNGSIGESYVRCYAWTETLEEALAMALPAFKSKYEGVSLGSGWVSANLSAQELFDSSQQPFCTVPNDSGWQVDK